MRLLDMLMMMRNFCDCWFMRAELDWIFDDKRKWGFIAIEFDWRISLNFYLLFFNALEFKFLRIKSTNRFSCLAAKVHVNRHNKIGNIFPPKHSFAFKSRNVLHRIMQRSYCDNRCDSSCATSCMCLPTSDLLHLMIVILSFGELRQVPTVSSN